MIRWAKLDELLADGFEDLLLQHWEEVALDKDAIPFAPDWDRYRKLERDGIFRALGMWEDNRLVGYNAFFIAPNMHYRTSLQAINDVIYADPSIRGAGFWLIRTAEKRLTELGVQKVHYHTKLHVDIGGGTAGDLLRRMGYVHSEEMFAKMLRSPPWPEPQELSPPARRR